MAHRTGKDMDFEIDNAAGTSVSIKGSVNSATIRNAVTLLEDSGLGDTWVTSVPGLAAGSIPVNGWVDSTTSAIFAPLVGGNTSITKSVGVYNGVRWFTCEAWPENVEFSGTPDTLVTWSCDLRVSGAITSTSVAP